MKKVLILAYDFPPYVSVGGLRPYAWYKYLHEFGVYPVVVTRQWSNSHGSALDYIAKSKYQKLIIEENDFGTLIRTPYRPNISNRLLLKYGANRFVILRKLITAYFEIAQFVYPCGPKAEIYKAAKEYLMTNDVDCIIATGDPFVLFSFARRLSKEFSIPWVADYRDPWSASKDYQSNLLLKMWNTRNERKILSDVTAITTVSDFLVHIIRSTVGYKPTLVLPNGYDPEAVKDVHLISQRKDVLTIALVGTIYNWHPIGAFLRCLCSFYEQNNSPKVELHFYGVNNSSEIEALINDSFPEISSIVSFSPKIPNDILLRKLAESHVMLLFNYYAYMGTKIFDYMAIRRKILLCFSEDKEAEELKKKYYNIDESSDFSRSLQADTIELTNSGIVVKDQEHLLKILHELYEEFQSTRTIACDSVHVEQFSRKQQTEKLAQLIHSLGH